MASTNNISHITHKSDFIDYFTSSPSRQKVYNDFCELSERLLRKRAFKPKSNQYPILVFDSNEIPFSLDLHGFTEDAADSAVSSFILKAKRHNLPVIRIIYGYSGDVLRSIVEIELQVLDLDGQYDDDSFYDKSYVDVRLQPDTDTWQSLSKHKNTSSISFTSSISNQDTSQTLNKPNLLNNYYYSLPQQNNYNSRQYSTPSSSAGTNDKYARKMAHKSKNIKVTNHNIFIVTIRYILALSPYFAFTYINTGIASGQSDSELFFNMCLTFVILTIIPSVSCLFLNSVNKSGVFYFIFCFADIIIAPIVFYRSGIWVFYLAFFCFMGGAVIRWILTTVIIAFSSNNNK